MTQQPIIIVHGGAGDIPNSRVQPKILGVKASAKIGYQILTNGGSAVDAVEAAVVYMEDNLAFNAGKGSVLNLRGEVEMEASIMTGDFQVGGVTLVKEFANPIKIARKVLTESPHCLLGGEGAKLFAINNGFTTVDPDSLVSSDAMLALQNFLSNKTHGITEIGQRDLKPESSIPSDVGTVGAVAIDCHGRIAAATSTGGMSGKAVGRIGDTPQIGSGTYADELVGGVSTTGHGESILRYCLAHSIIRNMDAGQTAQEATRKAVEGMTKRTKETAGAITLSKSGDVGIYFSSKRMAWAYVTNDSTHYGIEGSDYAQDNL